MTTQIHNTIIAIICFLALATLISIICSLFEPLTVALFFLIGAIANLVTLLILVYLYE